MDFNANDVVCAGGRRTLRRNRAIRPGVSWNVQGDEYMNFSLNNWLSAAPEASRRI